MRLYYIDDKNNKRLVAEEDSLEKTIMALDKDMSSKFVFSKEFKFKSNSKGYFNILNNKGEETGYLIEE